MTEYGVLHRCVFLTGTRGPGFQCRRRARWLREGAGWLCRQHYDQAWKMELRDVLVCIAKPPQVQLRLFS
jgi:hypothetical protein